MGMSLKASTEQLQNNPAIFSSQNGSAMPNIPNIPIVNILVPQQPMICGLACNVVSNNVRQYNRWMYIYMHNLISNNGYNNPEYFEYIRLINAYLLVVLSDNYNYNPNALTPELVTKTSEEIFHLFMYRVVLETRELENIDPNFSNICRQNISNLMTIENHSGQLIDSIHYNGINGLSISNYKNYQMSNSQMNNQYNPQFQNRHPNNQYNPQMNNNQYNPQFQNQGFSQYNQMGRQRNGGGNNWGGNNGMGINNASILNTGDHQNFGGMSNGMGVGTRNDNGVMTDNARWDNTQPQNNQHGRFNDRAFPEQPSSDNNQNYVAKPNNEPVIEVHNNVEEQQFTLPSFNKKK